VTVSASSVARLLDDLAVEVIDEAMEATDGIGPLIRLAGLDLDQRQEHYRIFRQRLVARFLAGLIETGVLTVRPDDPAKRAVVHDAHLRDSLKDGFDEGRLRPQGSQKVGESSTKPETYEQLQLPGMEDT
jgi:hypothetical protein